MHNMISVREAFRRRIVTPKLRRGSDHDYYWTKQQEQIRDRIFLRRKWKYDASYYLAYGVNQRMRYRDMHNKKSRVPKEGYK